MNNEIETALKNEGTMFVIDFEFAGKKYIKAVKNKQKGIEYIYYEMTENLIKKVEDEDLIKNFKELYEIKSDGNIY